MANFVQPKVFKLASTKLDNGGVTAWLKDLDGSECLSHITGSDEEKLIELCGRRCYKSFRENLNPNVTKMRKSSADYHTNIKKSAHGSVGEHPSVTFALENVSRVLTHELVRHRVGVAYAQESLRYVRFTDINMFFPNIFKEFGEEKEQQARELAMNSMKQFEDIQKDLLNLFKDELENGEFSLKKKLTSAFRRFAPIGFATGIIFTFNFRSLRHLIEMRTSKHAEEEIRLVTGMIYDFLKNDYPFFFDDYAEESTGDGMSEMITPYRKI